MDCIAGRFFQLGELEQRRDKFAAEIRIDTARAMWPIAAFALLDFVRVDVAAVFHVRLERSTRCRSDRAC